MGRKTNYHTYNAAQDWDNVNPKNKELVKEFMNYLSATDKSPQTREKYLHNLKLFFQYILNNRDNKYFPELKKRDFMAWQSYLVDEQELSPSRVRVLRSSVSSLSNFCENILADDEDYEEFKSFRNLLSKIPAPALEKIREKTFLTSEQIYTLLGVLEERHDWQKYLYVLLSFLTGGRKAEILQFKRSDFTSDSLQKNGMYKTTAKRCKGRGKQGKIRNFVIPSDQIDKYLKLYLDTREDDIDDLFVTKHKGEFHCIDDGTVNHWCNDFSKILGVPVYPHCFRASIATVLAQEKGKDPTKIQKLLGHNDVSTTMIYIKPNDEEDIEDLYN